MNTGQLSFGDGTKLTVLGKECSGAGVGESWSAQSGWVKIGPGGQVPRCPTVWTQALKVLGA